MTTAAAPARPTTDLDTAKADLDEHGYCLIGGLLPPDRPATLRSRLVALAEQEIRDGTDYVYEDGANQRVWTLLNKGDSFVELAIDPTALEIIGSLIGPDFLLSNIDANIAGPGGKPMFLHADQSFVPTPWPPYSLVANIMWMLDDFTSENGATRVAPGSHRSGRAPDLTISDEQTVPVCAPAGTAMVIDGRLWHQTGANVTEDERRHGILAYYCRPFMRQQESWFLSIDPAVLERWGAPLRHLLGYDLYLSLGMIDGMPRTGPRY
jgi:ectoine hydroxylase-related dioxygenase (phytanoyl-CoA dioxygenase family)